ncbi:MAG: UvrD-helicase domain-containing protein [Chloroflexota bacterium]|nr:UvrD-helicase domain-containing protein [Chloroflexota bacterium]
MGSPDRATARSSWLSRLWPRGPSGVSIDGGTLRVEHGRSVTAEIPVGSLDALDVRRSWFWHRLHIRTASGASYAIAGLDGRSAAAVADAARAAAVHRASTIGPELQRVDDALRRFVAGDRYARRSAVGTLHADLASVVRQCHGALARNHLQPDAAAALARLAPLEPAAAFEAARERANERFAQERVVPVQAAARSALRVPLTDEQALAIATDEDSTLVLAGAGTGKTAVIIGKVAHLVRNEGVPPQEILVLAFNADAAEEVRQRLPADLKATNVFTFHAFGRRVIADTDVAPTISRLAQDDVAFQRAVDETLRALVDDPGQSGAVMDFVAHHRAPYRSPFDFRSAGEYYEHVRNAELRTLSGDLVKSVEELEIANFLTLNSIEFRYEQAFVEPTATQEHAQYQPDFYLPAYDIYIEHFALDENGRPPTTWKRYAEGVEWKRSIHAELGTRLIETYSWQHRLGVLRDVLREHLEEANVAFEPIPMHTAIARLARWLLSWLARLLTTFLHHVKTSSVPVDELRERARASDDPQRAASFLAVFEQVRERYEAMLGEEEAVDFHDLINHAAGLIHDGAWKAPYRYILVDEFQDISAGRMGLLEALKRDGVAYFLVGDDWQSIYRFAGSDVDLLRNCGDHLGHVRQRTLSQTFRFADGILRPSTGFVQRNPAQTPRPLRSAREHDDDGITIVADGDPGRGLFRALQDIRERTASRGEAPSVLVLGRYNNSRGAMPRSTAPLRVEFSTVHRAKGREADYVVVLDLKNERRGFPSQVEDDPLLDLVLPSGATGYPHAEERRLFYVAMTRARRGAYLVTDPQQPSAFVTELRHDGMELRQLGALPGDDAPECPRCLGGKLIRSQSGDTLRCSNHPMCRHLAPRCGNCNAGYAIPADGRARCTNGSCARPPRACPECGVGVLVTRYGRYGQFLGCTEYGREPPCTYTENLPRR